MEQNSNGNQTRKHYSPEQKVKTCVGSHFQNPIYKSKPRLPYFKHKTRHITNESGPAQIVCATRRGCFEFRACMKKESYFTMSVFESMVYAEKYPSAPLLIFVEGFEGASDVGLLSV